MSSLTLRVNNRPLRIGFLVRDGNLQDIEYSAQINTALWGGIYNPIIPVGDNLDFSESLVSLFRCDLLFPTSNDKLVLDFFSKFIWLKWPDTFDEPNLFSRDEANKRLLVLDIVPIISYYWDKIYRSKNEVNNDAVFISWDENDALNLVFTILFGKYPKILQRDYKNDFKRGMKSSLYTITSDIIPEELYEKVKPLYLTKDKLIQDTIDSQGLGGIYVGNPDDFYDIISFWNLRASGKNILFLPISTYNDKRLKNYSKAHLSLLSRIIPYVPEYDKYIDIWYSKESDYEKDIKLDIADILPKDVQILLHKVSSVLWNGHNIRPPLYQFESCTILANANENSYGIMNISIEAPKIPLPDEIPYECNNQLYALNINTITEFELKNYIFKFPMLPKLNNWFRQQCHIINELRVQSGGISIIRPIYQNILNISPVPIHNLILGLLKHSDITSQLSQAGMIAERIIQQMGGLNGCKVFQITGVRKIIEDINARNGMRKGEITKIIHENNFAKFTKLVIEPRNKSILDTTDVFTYLLKKSVLRAGIKPNCPNCKLDSWLSLEALNDYITCEYCGNKYLLSIFLKDRDWSYRLSGLFGRDNNQEGSIPVILTLLKLQQRHFFHTFLYSTALKLRTDSITCETDLLVVDIDDRGNTSILIGECKSNKEIDDRDVHNLIKMRELITKSGIDCYIIFSKTADTFSENELKRFKCLQINNIPIILFTSRELESNQLFEGIDYNKLPHSYKNDFDDLSKKTTYLYLDEII